MLAVSIICCILEFVFFFSCTAMVINENSCSYAWIMVLLLIACTIVCVIGLVSGIKGIKDRSIRGRSIATTAVSSVGILTGFIFSIYAMFMVAYFIAAFNQSICILFI